jgi:hypothetical protein
MALTNDDLTRIQAFFSPIENRIIELEKRIEDRFDTIDQNFDSLFKRDETSQHEYLAVTEQLTRL